MKTNSWGKRATSKLVARALVALAAACGGSGAGARAVAPPGVSSAPARGPVEFAFDSLDDRPVSAQATRGKPTVIALVTTGSLQAQAQADFLVAMANHDGDRVNYALVALEKREDREIVELYAKALSIRFPVAMADAQTMSGLGPFGDVSIVPVTVVLDRAGRITWRVDGRVAKSDELRAAMRGL